jgi:hypothetical protein
MAKRIQALELNLTAEEEAAAERIYQAVREQQEQQLRNMVRSLAAKKPEELLGRGEFELREQVLQMGAQVLEAAVNEAAKKGGLRVS